MKEITLPSHKLLYKENPMNQSNLKANIQSQCKAQENVCKCVTSYCGFTFDWMKKWHKFFVTQSSSMVMQDQKANLSSKFRGQAKLLEQGVTLFIRQFPTWCSGHIGQRGDQGGKSALSLQRRAQGHIPRKFQKTPDHVLFGNFSFHFFIHLSKYNLSGHKADKPLFKALLH